MTQTDRRQSNRSRWSMAGFGGIIVLSSVLLASGGLRSDLSRETNDLGPKPTGYPQLVSVEPLPEVAMGGELCAWIPAPGPVRLAAALRQERFTAQSPSAAVADGRGSVALNRPPVRVIRDPYPTYSAVAVDPKNNEIVLQDENLFQLMVYDRLTNTPASARLSEPKRIISGHDTKVEFNCAIYIDPKTGDLYSVNNDTLDTMTVFSRNQRGNEHPARELSTPHRTYGIAVDEAREEMFLTVQDPPMVVVYNKYAKGQDKPLRVLRGNRTGLEDPHGIGLDTKNGWMFVANYGNVAAHPDGGGNSLPGRGYGEMLPGSGRYEPPSITVYPIQASGDTRPLRVIEGADTQLNWPAHISLDEEHGEIYVANDGTDAILVFRVTDSGNVAPARVLKGAKTQIQNPTGVYVDTVNNELVVANMGNHRATVYPRTAQGDTPPIRTIRTAADGTPALQIGNPGAVAYDSKRDELLVPNWVAHPQIAAFARLAKGGDAPRRRIFGQATKLSRTMHDIRYNEARDEFYVNNPFAQAILTFRGGADGQEAPIRVIQGPKTKLISADTLEIDTTNNEIFVPQGDEVLVFPMMANGDVAPIRVVRGGAKTGWKSGGGVAVDPVHNLLITDGTVEVGGQGYRTTYRTGRESILMFDRTANGEVKPLRVIRGPKTGIQGIRQMQVLPKGGWIVITQITDGGIAEPEGTFVGVWSINDNGDVPPRWKIEGKGNNIMKKPRGVALDLKHKEVIVSDMRLNAVLTFYFPEIF